MSTHASGTTARQRASTATGGGAKGRGGESAMPRVLSDAERAQKGLPREESRSREEEPLRSRGPIAGYRYDPRAPLDPYMLSQLYGEEHLGRALGGYSRQSLSDAVRVVQQRHPGTSPKDARSKNSQIRYITRMVTGGRYGAEFLPEATGARAKNGQSQRGQRASATPRAARTSAANRPPVLRGREMSPNERVAWGLMRRDASGREVLNQQQTHANPYFQHALYGATQLRTALDRMSMKSLRESARVVQHFNPGTRPANGRTAAGLKDYIVEHVNRNPQPPFNADDLPIWG